MFYPKLQSSKLGLCKRRKNDIPEKVREWYSSLPLIKLIILTEMRYM